MIKWIYLAVGGVAGTFSRYALAGFVYGVLGTDFPYGTLAVNLSGCFLVGFLASLAEEKFLLSPNGRLLWMIGFCGAFTTFSTFMLETAHLMKDDQMLRALLNVLASVLVGFFVFRAGVFLAEIL